MDFNNVQGNKHPEGETCGIVHHLFTNACKKEESTIGCGALPVILESEKWEQV